jgi:hypothetical protein
MSTEEIQDLQIGEQVKFAEIETLWKVSDKRPSGLVVESIPRPDQHVAIRRSFRTWTELTTEELHRA